MVYQSRYSGKKNVFNIHKFYLFSDPPPDKYSTRLFFKWVRTQGCSPHVQQNPKIPSAPLAFPQRGSLRRQETKQQTTGKKNACFSTGLNSSVFVAGLFDSSVRGTNIFSACGICFRSKFTISRNRHRGLVSVASGKFLMSSTFCVVGFNHPVLTL